MYKLDLPIDYKEAAAIERRKNQEEQRKSRIFNAKTRIIGVDVQALEQQAMDRKQMEDLENKRDQAFANDAIRNDMIASLLDKRQNHDMHELNKGLNEFRFLHQQPNARREFDLYDPDGLKKDKPARVTDDDPRCGISSLQKFDGEDLNNPARTKFQQEQLREWSAAQAREKNQAKLNQEKADRLYELKMKELDQRAMELNDAEEACRRAINVATTDYNQALAREMRSKKDLKEQQDLDDKMTEMGNHIYGDFLTENPAVAQSAFGPHRVVPDRWKGMSPEQLADIRRAQELQRLEKQERENSTKRELNKKQELDDNMTELANHIYGDILTENPAVAQSAFGSHRVIPDRWKGMSPEQLADIRRVQDSQRREIQRIEEENRRRDGEWERQNSANARAGMLLEREKERRERDLRKQYADENRTLANSQKAHKDYMDQEVYTNPPNAAYFMQFNTSTR